MQAIVHDTYGPPTALKTRELGDPAPDDHAVLVRVRAAGVNRGDVLAVEGIPYATRLATGLTGPRRRVPGADVAGVVEAVGTAVTDLRPGDEVLGWAEGAFAELASARPGLLVGKPTNLTFEQAAAVPTAAVTALQALHRAGPLPAGRHVLVIGASGGVGTFAVQLAKALGAEVTGVAGPRNVELVRSAGADHVLDYTRDDVTGHTGRYDLVVDLVGRESLRTARRVLRPAGTYVVVGGQNPRSLTGMSRFAGALALSPCVRQRLRPLFATRDRAALERVTCLAAEGRVLPVIDATYDLRDATDALGHVGAGHSRGRVVLTA
ncbi:NAD(P)-dependent alcohol dehydrogenase [Pseudonocardia hydrocarbonoxydans]|uniref:NADPH:quinone reductase n=1 Tax=Pseudonocardia hydrocarbonoxydans TaxID=76726 RepID=A0A4Y3WWE3_9PSEU|nr:NAD(P)-dependent alcohol dehydrogenase [Pseudonocardia hydrocarbonoxydans]GEC22888.1 NADPH:quinone reductase [Pseudonocardia hydrocarbonoxydans]